MESRLLESTTSSNDQYNNLINQSKYLDIINIPEDSLYTFGTIQFGLIDRLCRRAFQRIQGISREDVVFEIFQQSC